VDANDRITGLKAGHRYLSPDKLFRPTPRVHADSLHESSCRAYTNLAVMYAALDPERSERCRHEGIVLAEKIGDRLQQAWLYCVLAGGHCTITGDYDEGVRAAETAVELDEHLGQQNHLPVPLIILAQIHQCRGDHERGEH
jgi:hypothetical protein